MFDLNFETRFEILLSFAAYMTIWLNMCGAFMVRGPLFALDLGSSLLQGPPGELVLVGVPDA